MDKIENVDDLTLVLKGHEGRGLRIKKSNDYGDPIYDSVLEISNIIHSFADDAVIIVIDEIN